MYQNTRRFIPVFLTAAFSLFVVLCTTAAPCTALTVLASECQDADPEPATYTVMSIRNSSLLSRFPEQSFSSAYPEKTEAELNRIQTYCTPLHATITDGQVTSDITLDVIWNTEGINLTTPGNYQMTGLIQFPDSVIPGDDTLRQIIVPVRILDDNVPLPVISLMYDTHLNDLTVLNAGDTSGWAEVRNRWAIWLNSVEGYTEEKYIAHICLDYLELSEVDMDTPGTYTVTAWLKLSDNNLKNFSLPEDVSYLQLSVEISEPEALKLYLLRETSTAYTLSSPAKPGSMAKLQYLKSPVPLSEDELSCSEDWNTYSLLTDFECLESPTYSIYKKNLESGSYYYFRLTEDGRYSNAVYLESKPSTPSSDMGGDRDGGDTAVPSPPKTDIPAQPDEPAAPEESPYPAEPSGINPQVPVPSEEVSETVPSPAPHKAGEASSILDETGGTEASSALDEADQAEAFSVPDKADGTEASLSGLKLRLMNDHADLRFSENDILVILSQEGFDSLLVSDTDSFTIVIDQSSSLSLSVLIKKNGLPVTRLPGTTIMLPFTPSSSGSFFTVCNEETGTISEGIYDPDTGILSFTADETGVFTITEHMAAADSAPAPVSEAASCRTPSVIYVLPVLTGAFLPLCGWLVWQLVLKRREHT